jgi:Raf kinase inhibitor-like YbhB/YbcL family protein
MLRENRGGARDAAQLAGANAMAFQINSPDLQPDQPIPRAHTCDGEDRAPALAWSGAPPKTSAFALIVHDPDAPRGDWVHWVVFDLPRTTRSLRSGAGPDGGTEGTNDFGKTGWGGPCPPPGSAHRYVFELYALDAPIGLPAGSSRDDVQRAMKGHVLGRASLVGRYARRAGA